MGLGTYYNKKKVKKKRCSGEEYQYCPGVRQVCPGAGGRGEEGEESEGQGAEGSLQDLPRGPGSHQ